MAVTVVIPAQFRSSVEGRSEVLVDGATVEAILLGLCGRYPALQPKLFDESGEKRKTVNIYLNREDIHYAEGLGTQAKDGDEMIILPPAAGG